MNKKLSKIIAILKRDTITTFQNLKTDNNLSFAPVLICPYCNASNLHYLQTEQIPKGLWIYFWCENCFCVSKLALYTHKGLSYIEWIIAKNSEEVKIHDPIK